METVYRVLPEGHIRILTVASHEGNLNCELRSVLRDKIDFDALSYCWGDQNNQRPIVCNGVQTTVTANLYEFLKVRARTHPPKSRPVWVDALCLNQNDSKEKAIQVPMMDQIYGLAKTVFVWLGRAENHSDEAMQKGAGLGARLALLKGDKKLNPARLAENKGLDLPSQEDNLWVGLGHLCRRDWWERTWVIQEVALAVNEPVVLCGEYGMTWNEFSVLITALKDTDLKNVCLNAAGADIRVDLTDAFSAVNHINIYREAIARGNLGWDLLPLLQMSRLKKCLVDVDRIYGMIGLMTPNLREAMKKHDFVKYPEKKWLAPNVPNQEGNYETYIKIGRFWMQYDFPLLSLSMASSQDRPARLPSWCANWASPQLYNNFGSVQSYHAGFTAKAVRKAKVYTNSFTDSIRVLGFRVDVVDKVVENFYTWSQDQEKWKGKGGCAAKLHQWSTECLKLAQEVYSEDDFSDAYWRTLMGNKTSEIMAASTQAEAFWLKGVQAWREAIKTYMAGQSPKWREGEQRAVWDFQTHVEHAAQGRKFFSTKNGRIGLGPPDIKAGDVVCVLLSAAPVFILRFDSASDAPRPDLTDKDLVKQLGHTSLADSEQTHINSFQKKPATLIGDAYVHGLMYGEGLSMDSREDEIFLIG